MVASEEEDDDDEENDDNMGSSGSHINDSMNQPDAAGRVLVNIGHPLEDPDIFLLPQIARIVKPHQVNTSHDKLLIYC